jgi:hypothetical protein
MPQYLQDEGFYFGLCICILAAHAYLNYYRDNRYLLHALYL